MDLRALAAKALADLGYDGLYNEADDCACKADDRADDLFPCGAPSLGGCKPGYLGKCDAATCPSGGGCGWHITATKDDESEREV